MSALVHTVFTILQPDIYEFVDEVQWSSDPLDVIDAGSLLGHLFLTETRKCIDDLSLST